MGEAARMLHMSAASQEMLRITGDMLDVGVLIVDQGRRVRMWNQWLETASGLRAIDVVGLSLHSLTPNLLKPAGEAAFQKAFAGGTAVHSHRLHEYLLSFPAPPGHPEFERMQQSARIAPLYDEDGKVTCAVAFIEDVTSRVASEEELRAAIRAAQSADRAKSDFLAKMSHELRTPIGAISGYADLMIEGILGPISDLQREHLTRVKGVGNHLLRVVDEILSFARLEARGESLTLQSVDARTVVANAASAVEPLAHKKGLVFRLETPNHPVTIRTDVTKLQQVMINLLGNAVKFTERGSITTTLSDVPNENCIRMTVRDTGNGIAAEDHERIFEPFVQARASLSRSHDGTGLGLAVSRQLARILGGDITLDSAPGSGSTFVVSVPR